MGEAPSTKIHLQTNVTYMNRWFLFAADSWCAWVNYHAFFSGEGSKGEGWKKCKIDEQCKEVALDSFDNTKQRQLILCNWSIKEKKNTTKLQIQQVFITHQLTDISGPLLRWQDPHASHHLHHLWSWPSWGD